LINPILPISIQRIFVLDPIVKGLTTLGVGILIDINVKTSGFALAIIVDF